MSIAETRLRKLIRLETRRLMGEAVHPRDRGTMWDPKAGDERGGDYPEPGADDDDGGGPGDTEFSPPTNVENLVHVFRQYHPDLAREYGRYGTGERLLGELVFRLRQIAKESGIRYTEADIESAAQELAGLVNRPVSRRRFY